MNPWDTLDSIWDGWTGQCRGHLRVIRGGYNPTLGLEVIDHCAAGFLVDRYQVTHWEQSGINQLVRFKDPVVDRRVFAVENWLRENLLGGVIPANDVLNWTPDQFRDLDRRLEYAHQQAQLGKQIDAIATMQIEQASLNIQESPETVEV